MDQHSTNDFKCEEILLEDYIWDNFSLFDTIKHKVHLFFVWFFCTLFNSHDWIILINPWTFSEIDTLEDFQKYRANKLKCSCCGIVKHLRDVELSPSEQICYGFRTNKFFKHNV